MKILSFQRNDDTSFGVLVDDGIIDAKPLLGHRYSDLKSVLEDAALEQLRERAKDQSPDYTIDEISFLPVVPNPNKIICVGLNYESHRIEAGRAKTEHPSIFVRFPDSQTGHNEPILMPAVSDKLDYEGELAVIIGKPGRYIQKADAMDHVAGYSCYNDGTVRDWQRHTIQFTPGKNFPGTGAFGPHMVTADSLGDVHKLAIQTRLNGKVMQDSNTERLIHDIPALISYISAFTPLSVGDVIATGTPGGVGFKREPAVYMKPGDEIVVEIESVGILKNIIRKE
ncbi:MAG: fumarylacetoacetate hydrolase family protein [Pseudomonadota bacterium]